MCYPSPGPRCSNHAYKEYVIAEKNFVNCVDPETKMVLGDKMLQKQKNYESTPRGQNELRRSADAAEGVERDQLLVKLAKAERLRKKHLDDYNYSIANRDTSFQELMLSKGYKKGRYQDACGIALMWLTEKFPHQEFHMESLDTIVSDDHKIFVVPEKYQDRWAEYQFDGVTFNSSSPTIKKLLVEHSNLFNPNFGAEQVMFSWFVEALKASGYTLVASVNRATQDVVVVPVEKISDLYHISFKNRKRLGGTTNFVGTVEELQSLLVGTVFENGTILQPEGLNKTVVYGIPPQTKENCLIGEDLFLSWRASTNPVDENKNVTETEELAVGDENVTETDRSVIESKNVFSGGYFEVRRRHISNNFNLIVALQVKRQISVSAISPDITFGETDESVEFTENFVDNYDDENFGQNFN